MNNPDEQEYRIPVKVLTNRDPIIAGKFSMRELGQWLVALGLLYVTLNLLPFPFQIKAILAAFILMGAVIFIHVPVNGLAGIEWVFVSVRYRLERRLHDAEPTPLSASSALLAASRRPTFTIATATTTNLASSDRDVRLASGVVGENENDSKSESEEEI